MSEWKKHAERAKREARFSDVDEAFLGKTNVVERFRDILVESGLSPFIPIKHNIVLILRGATLLEVGMRGATKNNSVIQLEA